MHKKKINWYLLNVYSNKVWLKLIRKCCRYDNSSYMINTFFAFITDVKMLSYINVYTVMIICIAMNDLYCSVLYPFLQIVQSRSEISSTETSLLETKLKNSAAHLLKQGKEYSDCFQVIALYVTVTHSNNIFNWALTHFVDFQSWTWVQFDAFKHSKVITILIVPRYISTILESSLQNY